MLILVTGGAGYIGSIVVDELVNSGYQVIVIDNLQEGHKEAVSSKAHFYLCDVGDKDCLDKIFRNNPIDVVMHFAAETTVKFSMTDPSKYFVNNVVNGINLLEVMKKHNCRKIIFSSTAAIFGEPEYAPIDENHPKNPVNAYGESKLIFEKILDWYNKAYGFMFNSFRYFNAAGATKKLGESHKHETHLIPLVLLTALKKRKIVQIFGTDYPTKDGTCIRDYIHVVDLAKAHILGIKNLEKHVTGKYNLGNGKGFSVLEVIEAAKQVTGINIPVEVSSRRRGDPAILVALSELIKNELGWIPEFKSLEEIIESAWSWHKAHPDGYS